MNKKKVLVVDDSAVMRELLSSIINQHPELDVVGIAANPNIARKKIAKLNPDVITLDVEMPEMDGVTFLQNLMQIHPMPVVMVSSLTKKGADITLRALELGAVDFVTKPDRHDEAGIENFSNEIISRVFHACEADVAAVESTPRQRLTLPNKVAKSKSTSVPTGLVVIGASTGGPQAIQEVLCNLPLDCPPIAIVQHMPPRFTQMYADRVDKVCNISVSEAQDQDKLTPGSALIAPGGMQMRLSRTASVIRAEVTEDPPVNQHRPSVDVLLDSVIPITRHMPVMSIILTGMGKDGSQGMLKLRQSGAHTVAQDKATSIIFGMPDQAIKLGAATKVLPLHKIAGEIVQWWASIQHSAKELVH
ncbi:MAG: chemotaxis response regulator protein-glutamate methylesterase [Proteobacteria bacterium]|nr:chemotaxis response regulator protein-glutamate methylesterase [Pseudomonadota bacterium]